MYVVSMKEFWCDLVHYSDMKHCLDFFVKLYGQNGAYPNTCNKEGNYILPTNINLNSSTASSNIYNSNNGASNIIIGWLKKLLE